MIQESKTKKKGLIPEKKVKTNIKDQQYTQKLVCPTAGSSKTSRARGDQPGPLQQPTVEGPGACTPSLARWFPAWASSSPPTERRGSEPPQWTSCQWCHRPLNNNDKVSVRFTKSRTDFCLIIFSYLLRDLDSITSNLAVHILGEYKVSVRLLRVGQNSAWPYSVTCWGTLTASPATWPCTTS